MARLFFEEYFCVSSSIHSEPHVCLLPAQRPSMDQLIEFYFELGIRYADIVLLLSGHGYVISNHKRILRSRGLSRRKQYSNLQDAVGFIREQLLY